MSDEILVVVHDDDDSITVIVSSTGERGTPGVGLPAGGVAGDLAFKQSSTDYDTVWRQAETADISGLDAALAAIADDVADAQTDIVAEIAARAAADTTLQNNINAEASTRATADTTEASTRAAADTTLQTNITAEAATRASADTTLQGNITTEASARAAADALLIPLTQKGAASGVADLDGTGKVPIAQLPATVLGAVSYQGTWNANTNSPTIPAASSSNKGWYYRVSVAGSTSIDGITDWKLNDWIISNGSAWEKVDNTDQVTSVFGRQGAVVAAPGDYALADITGLQAALDLKATIVALLAEETARIADVDAEESARIAAVSSEASTRGSADTAQVGRLDAIEANNWVTTARIAAGQVTNAKLADMVEATMKGRAAGAGTGAPTDLTASQIRTLQGLGALALLATVGASQIDDAAVSNAKLANMVAASFKGRQLGGGTGVPEDLTAAQLRTAAGLVIGTDVQAFHALLLALAGLDTTSGSVPTVQAVGTPLATQTGGAIVWPAHQPGDVALLFIAHSNDDTTSFTDAAGFQALPDSPQATGGTGGVNNESKGAFYWHRATSSAMANPVIADTGNHQFAVIITIRGCVPTGNPWDVTSGDATALGVQSTSVSIPGDTTTGANRLVVVAVVHGRDILGAQVSAWANTDLSGLVELFDDSTDLGHGAGIGVAAGTKTAAGAYGATTATLANQSGQARFSIALKPSPSSLIYASDVNVLSLAALSAAARSLLDDADYATMRATLGLVIGTNVQAYSAVLAAIAAFTGIADGTYLKRSGSSIVGDTPSGGGGQTWARSFMMMRT